MSVPVKLTDLSATDGECIDATGRCEAWAKEPATYTHDGEPLNLPAAASDALEWLDLLLERRNDLPFFDPTSTATLARCRSALRRFVGPHLPARFEEKPRQFPYAVAEIVAFVNGRGGDE